MALTINQAMQSALEAHKLGKLKKARRFYDEVLEMEPRHPDANHNLGAIEVTEGHFHKAAPFLKKALEINPNNPQYWVSYIDTLLNIEEYEEAREWLEKAKFKGASGEIFDHFTLKIDAATGDESITNIIENFYINSKSAIVNNAAQGWYYSAFFNKEFMKKRENREPAKTPSRQSKKKQQKVENTKSAGEILDQLNSEKNIIPKYKLLKKLINESDPNLIKDSFSDTPSLQEAQDQVFSPNSLNIVVIGAGVTGLFFANILKNKLGDKLNILLLDHRSPTQHSRKPYNREWLTHIPSETVQQFTPPNIHELFECFGKGGLIGIQINMLEAILKLSCKEIGVKFFYHPEIELDTLNHSSIDFFVDATGGRFGHVTYDDPNVIKEEIALQKIVSQFTYTGIVPENRSPKLEMENFEVTLKPAKAYHYPYINGANIHTPMIKNTAVPEKYLQKIDKFITPLNEQNKFFIWKGALKAEFNEGLIFINLTNEEFDLLNSNLNQEISIKTFIEDSNETFNSLSKDIIAFINMLNDLDQNDDIMIEQPFSYSPYINLNAESGKFQDKPIYPIGDSYFTGNPKVGNGLWTHLGFINDLVKNIISAQKNIKH